MKDLEKIVKELNDLKISYDFLFFGGHGQIRNMEVLSESYTTGDIIIGDGSYAFEDLFKKFPPPSIFTHFNVCNFGVDIVFKTLKKLNFSDSLLTHIAYDDTHNLQVLGAIFGNLHKKNIDLFEIIK